MSYELYTSPVGFDFRHMSRKDAKKFFLYFLDSIPNRLNLLTLIVRETSGFESWDADYTDISIKGLETWIFEVAEARQISTEEREALENSMSSPLSSISHIIFPVDLSLKTYSICFDIGIYMGELLCHRYSEVDWSLGSGPKTGVLYNSPIIGTADGRFMWDILSDPIETIRRYLTDGHKYDFLNDIKNIENRIVKRF